MADRGDAKAPKDLTAPKAPKARKGREDRDRRKAAADELIASANTLKRGRIPKRPVNSLRPRYEAVALYARRVSERLAELAVDAAIAAWTGDKAAFDATALRQADAEKYARVLAAAGAVGEGAVVARSEARQAAADALAALADDAASGKAGGASAARRLAELRAEADAATRSRAELQLYVRVGR